MHGGDRFSQPTLIEDSVLAQLAELNDLAPLHNPANLKGIHAARELLGPGVTEVAVFDTAFHATMPERSFLYGIPYQYYRRYKIRRYGFHGTSHQYVAGEAARLLNKPLGEVNLVSAHLGNGASAAAVEGGRSIDTSMGLTPLEGLIMGTRSGDMDPAIVPWLMAMEELTLHQVNTMMNKHSGLYGISGVSSDMRELLEEELSRTAEKDQRFNEQLVLRTVYDQGPISRADVARATRLTRTTVSDLVEVLMMGSCDVAQCCPQIGDSR